MGWSPNTSSDPWTETQTPNITLTPASVHPAGCEKGNREKNTGVYYDLHSRQM